MTPERTNATALSLAFDLLASKYDNEPIVKAILLRAAADLAEYTRTGAAPVDIAALLAEIRRLTARVAELEEAARWRRLNVDPAPDRGAEAEVQVINVGRMIAKRTAEPRRDPWVTRSGTLEDWQILGWRPLSPGPEMSK